MAALEHKSLDIALRNPPPLAINAGR